MIENIEANSLQDLYIITPKGLQENFRKTYFELERGF